jgi:hypothetical protein
MTFRALLLTAFIAYRRRGRSHGQVTLLRWDRAWRSPETTKPYHLNRPPVDETKLRISFPVIGLVCDLSRTGTSHILPPISIINFSDLTEL